MIKNISFSGALFLSSLTAAVSLGCGDNNDGNPIPGGGADGAPAGSSDPTAAANYTGPQGEVLAFGVEEGIFRNYFHRQGSVAVHLLTRSGEAPRIIAAFPTNNQGIGVWFEDVAGGTDMWVGERDSIATGGGVTAVVRNDSQMRGIRATVETDASSLNLKIAYLANIRTLRDYFWNPTGTTAVPELNDNTIELIAEHGVVRLSRTQIGGQYHMELLLKAHEGTSFAVNGNDFQITGDGGIKFDLIALSDEVPLTPIEKGELFMETPADSFELNALAFLTYQEKLQAGSWRFLTYFGRDTLLSVRMLMGGLRPEVIEAALSSVIERINMREGLTDPYFNFTVELGEIAHEEEVGDFAGWRNSLEETPPADLRTPRYDYKMVDDDFLLAPVLAEYFAQYPDRAEAFLARTRTADNMSYQDAIVKNLELVVARATPYALNPAASNLVALKDSVPVGEWRDSDEGLGFGRYAFNVNAALVPGALTAASTLYERFGNADAASDAAVKAETWTDIDQYFLITHPRVEAQNRVEDYAAAVNLDATPAQEIDTALEYYGIALDASGGAVPIMHTDHGFVMMFTNPSDLYLQRAATSISRTFPAGLMSEVGVMVANPAFAGDAMVTDPRRNEEVTLRSIFTTANYHGTVVWSWQQALLAAGIRRQLETRQDLAAATVTALEQAECKLWQTINKANTVRAGELWSWESVSGVPEYRAFGSVRSDVDESNAAQLWSTVYLVVKPPVDFDTRCTGK